MTTERTVEVGVGSDREVVCVCVCVGRWTTFEKGGICNIGFFSWNKGVSTPLSTMSRALKVSHPPPISGSASLLVQISNPPPPIIAIFKKISSTPPPFLWRGRGVQTMKTLDQCDSRLCHSKYYFIFTFFGNLHVNNGYIVGKYFNRIIVKIYTVNLYLCCNIYKI